MKTGRLTTRFLGGRALRFQPDGRLVSLVRDGYESAFEEIFRRYGAATDVWGIGVTLYEAATGTRPFPDAKPKQYPQRERRASSVAEARRAPTGFVSLVDGCLSPDPAARPSVVELADGLDAVIGP